MSTPRDINKELGESLANAQTAGARDEAWHTHLAEHGDIAEQQRLAAKDALADGTPVDVIDTANQIEGTRTDESVTQNPMRDTLIGELGKTASREMLTRNPLAMYGVLPNDKGAIHQEIRRAIGAHTDQRVALVDIVLGVDASLEPYVKALEGFYPRAIIYADVPAFLKELLPPQHAEGRRQVVRVWEMFIKKQYGLARGEPPIEHAPFGKHKTKHRVAGGSTASPQKQPKKSRAQKQARAGAKKPRSSSQEASAKAWRLTNED